MKLIKKGITIYEYVVAMRAMSEAPAGSIDDDNQNVIYSPSGSATTGFSGGSSLGLQYIGARCTPPRVFVDHQAFCEEERKEATSTKPAKKEKLAKDPPASAFFVFMEEFRKQFKEKNPNNKSVAAQLKTENRSASSLSLFDEVIFCFQCKPQIPNRAKYT